MNQNTDPLDGVGGEFRLNHATGKLEPLNAPNPAPVSPVMAEPEPDKTTKPSRGPVNVNP